MCIEIATLVYTSMKKAPFGAFLLCFNRCFNWCLFFFK